jgi:glycosyltransferase involved in cell wall biosynthesis
MNNERIAIFLPSLDGGGAERVMVNLANEFSKQGYIVDLVLVQARGAYKRIVLSSVNVIDLNEKRVLSSLPALIKYLNKYSPEVLLSTMTHANLVSVLAGMVSKQPTRVYVREANTLGVVLGRKKVFSKMLWSGLVKFLYKRASLIIAPSMGVARDLESHCSFPEGQVQVIYNPIVSSDLTNLMNEPVEHHWFNSKDERVILSVGRLTKQKDYPTLLQAFKQVVGSVNVRLVILGDGEEKRALQKLTEELCISDRVEFLGFVDNPFKFMRASDLFVLSSAWEGLPGVLIQAMACGCQVISTDCPSGPSEILNDGEYGTLVPVGNSQELASAICQSLSSGHSKYDTASRSLFFSVENSVRNYLSHMSL